MGRRCRTTRAPSTTGLGTLIGWGIGSIADLATGQSVTPPTMFNIGSDIFDNIAGKVNNGQPWNEQLPNGMGSMNPLDTGNVFGSGNTSPFVFSLTGAARLVCAAAGSESHSLNAGLAKVFGKAGYNPNNFFAGALAGSTTATISNFFVSEDPVTPAGQLLINSPFKINAINTVRAATGKITTTGKGSVKVAVDSGGRFFGVSEHAATLAGKGAFKTASKALGWVTLAVLVWDVGTYAYSYFGQCGN